MDPNAALQRIVTAAEEGDTEELIDAAQDLCDWLDQGGFVPTPVVLVRRFGGEDYNKTLDKRPPQQATPDEKDDFIGDATHGYSVMRGGKHLGTFPTEQRAAAALYLERERSSYWPNIWRINDHGNMTLCVFDSHVLRFTDTAYV